LIERVEALLGARVVSAEPVRGGGYTHNRRERVHLDDGRSVFVKAAVDDLSAGWLRLEHAVYSEVTAPFMPDFLGYDEKSGLPLLVIEDLSQAHWPPPWREGDVDRVRSTLAAVAATPAPRGLTPIGDWKAGWLSAWRTIRDDPEPFLATGVASRGWLESNLPALEAAAERAPLADGSSLLHLDVRGDNLALTERGAVLVDWNWASQGNPVVDLVAWAPSLCIETGMHPEDVVDADGVGELAALIGGVWASVAGLPPPPTAEQRLRDAQLAALRICLPWACRQLGVKEPG
jgi:Phosphotransferase enzyme family